MDTENALQQLGGIGARQELLDLGVTRYELGRACHAGRVIRIRRAWYALPGCARAAMVAVRVGGMLTCVSRLRECEIWTPVEDPLVHVSVADNASRLRSATARTVPRRADPAGVVLHWRPRAGATTTARDSVAGALVHMQDCIGGDAVVAAADSAVRQGLASVPELRAAGLRLATAALIDPRSESGSESLVRLRLRRLRIACRLQVPIPGVGRVDFLIGDRIVLEVDGYAFHGDREAFERDRARDLRLVSRGYLVIRISYRQVVEDWPRIERSILALVRSDRHLWPRRAA
ncbi:MAG: DUF559 domain-containing protein [Microbacteriaceae bacterium]|nr:DUF559 domain-containing protein [Microbacteriaceae bacterium]